MGTEERIRWQHLPHWNTFYWCISDISYSEESFFFCLFLIGVLWSPYSDDKFKSSLEKKVSNQIHTVKPKLFWPSSGLKTVCAALQFRWERGAQWRGHTSLGVNSWAWKLMFEYSFGFCFPKFILKGSEWHRRCQVAWVSWGREKSDFLRKIIEISVLGYTSVHKSQQWLE